MEQSIVWHVPKKEEDEEIVWIEENPLDSFHTPIQPNESVFKPVERTSILDPNHSRDDSFYLDLQKERAQKRLRLSTEQSAQPTEHVSSPTPSVTKSIPGRGPPKDELHERRMEEFGDLLIQLGVPLDDAKSTKPSSSSSFSSQRSMSTKWDELLKLGLVKSIRVKSDFQPLPLQLESPIATKPGVVIPIHYAKEEKQQWVMEYAEKQPIIQPIVEMPGMLIQVHVQNTVPADELPEIGHILALDSYEPSPLLTTIQPGKVYTLYKSDVANIPLFEHSSSQDFLLMPNENKMTIRPIQHTFLCGQVEPAVTIPSASEWSESFLKNWIQLHVIKRLYPLGVSDKCLVEMFPTVPLVKIHKWIKDLVVKNHHVWVAKLKREEMEKRLNELKEQIRYVDVAAWYSYQIEMHRLQTEVGLSSLHVADMSAVLYTYRVVRRMYMARLEVEQVASREASIPKIKKELLAIRFVIRELERTPWYLSYCFKWLFRSADDVQTPFPKSTIMQVNGFTDPSGRGEMVCFLPSFKFLLKENEEVEFELFDSESVDKNQKRKKKSSYAETKEVVGGTQNDIRIVSQPELNEILLKLGIPMERILTIKRWDKTWLILKIATDHPLGKLLLGGQLKKYYRNSLNDGIHPNVIQEQPKQDDQFTRRSLENSKHFQVFRERASLTFNRMELALSSTIPPTPLVLTNVEEDEISEEEEEFVASLMRQMKDNQDTGPEKEGIEALEDERLALEAFKKTLAVNKKEQVEKDRIAKKEASLRQFITTLPLKDIQVLKQTVVVVVGNRVKDVYVELTPSPSL